jgi:predicted RNase H-like HicB family nuclease
MEYLVILEQANDGSFSVSVPDLPGCYSCGDTVQEALEMVREAIRGHVQLLKDQGQPVPPPRSTGHVLRAA